VYEAALGKAIEMMIADNGLTREQVAGDSGLDPRKVGSLICGQDNPTQRTLLRLCDGLHTSPATLLALADELVSGFVQESRWRPTSKMNIVVLQRDTTDVVAGVANSKDPVVITRYGEPVAALVPIDVDDFEDYLRSKTPVVADRDR
jgi:prevent-host-death family protein